MRSTPPLNLNNFRYRDVKKKCLVDLVAQRQQSRFDLAQATRMSPSTVSQLVDELIRDGLLVEAGYGAPEGGRPPILLDVNPEGGYLVGLEFAAHSAFGIAQNLRGDVLLEEETSWGGAADQEHIWEHLTELVRHILAQLAVPAERLIGIGVASPGRVDSVNGVVEYFSHLPDWRNVPVRAQMEEAFGVPVHLDQNMRATALAEHVYGAGRGHETMAYVGGRDGIGAGLMLNGDLFRGSSFTAGQLGHSVIAWPGGPLCKCGRRGCLEAIVGPAALDQEVQELGLGKSIDALWDACRRGEPRALAIAERVAQYLGVALWNLVAFTDPSLIVLGGYLRGADDRFLHRIKEAISERAPVDYGTKVRLASTQLPASGGALGAAVLVWRNTFQAYRFANG